MGDKAPLDPCGGTFRGLPPDVHSAAQAAEARGDSAERRMRLEFLLRSEILPRLTDYHPSWPTQSGGTPAPSEADIERFAALVIQPDEESASEFLNRMLARGYDFETLVERLAAPTARRLGELWEQDQCDFLDVTFGVGRLQEILAMLSGAPPVVWSDRPRRALLIALPGDSHRFGLDIVGSLLTAAGWRVTMQRAAPPEENEKTVSGEWMHIVGVTMGNLRLTDRVSQTVRALRRASLNPDVSVIVGGFPFNRDPDLVSRVGADGSAPDGPTAVVLAKRLLLRQLTDGAFAPD